MNLTSHKSEAVHCRYAIVSSVDLRATQSGALGKTEYGGMAEWSMAVVLKTGRIGYDIAVIFCRRCSVLKSSISGHNPRVLTPFEFRLITDRGSASLSCKFRPVFPVPLTLPRHMTRSRAALQHSSKRSHHQHVAVRCGHFVESGAVARHRSPDIAVRLSE